MDHPREYSQVKLTLEVNPHLVNPSVSVEADVKAHREIDAGIPVNENQNVEDNL